MVKWLLGEIKPWKIAESQKITHKKRAVYRQKSGTRAAELKKMEAL